MPYRRRYRRRGRTRPVVQSYKKVINWAGASRPIGQTNFFISKGVDSVAAGQTTPTDVDVPTGSIIKYVEIQYAVSNLVAVTSFQHVSIQKIHSGQTPIDPRAVGGSPQRNQVHFQQLFNVGKEQNSNHVYRFKVPKKYQRVREGDEWQFNIHGDTVHSSAAQIIYKFYR